MPTSVWWLAFAAFSANVAINSGVKTTSPQPEDKQLIIAAFNIQNLGSSKMKKQEVMDIIVKIISQYDIILIQEIVDKQDIVMPPLLALLNSSPVNKRRKVNYNYVISNRLGRGAAKEQYAYVYRTDKVQIVKNYTYQEIEDEFEREPFIAIVKPTFPSKLTKFALAGIHVKPGVDSEKKKYAVEEVKRLHEVIEKVRTSPSGAPDIMIMGDFNAGCGFFPKKDWASVPLWTESSTYQWLIGHDVDTTVAKQSSCPYDRIIVTGDKIKQAVVEKSTFPFQFDDRFKLTEELTKAVSDHYPVQVTLDLN